MSGIFSSMLQLWFELPVLLGYLKGQTFHKPFSKEEEAACIERFLGGDEQARLDLIERNMRLVAHVVKNSIQSMSSWMTIFRLVQLGL